MSAVPEHQREFLNKQYSMLVTIVQSANITPLVPIERWPDADKDLINPINHWQLQRSRMVIPLAYAPSSGRDWEMGVAYMLGKLVLPLLLKDQKINRPSIRLPFQVPIIFDDLEKCGKKLEKLLATLRHYEIGRGKCSVHGDTVLGLHKEDWHCLRGIAENYFEVVPVKG